MGENSFPTSLAIIVGAAMLGGLILAGLIVGLVINAVLLA